MSVYFCPENRRAGVPCQTSNLKVAVAGRKLALLLLAVVFFGEGV
jgi:hypothetical protein